MAALTAAFERVIALAMAGVKPPDQQKLHAATARAGLAEHLAGLRHRPAVVTIVDGRTGASEDSVKPYGVIRYEFRRLSEAAAWALARCRELSPVDSGDYKAAWFVLAAGRPVPDGQTPPELPELIVTNDLPYHRKLEVTVNSRRLHGGVKSIRVPPGIVERVRQEVRRAFPGVDASVSFITLAGGYTLRGRAPRKAAAQNRRSSAFRAGRKTLTLAKDRRAGQPMTYPALVLRWGAAA
jgi:hypothetical protein